MRSATARAEWHGQFLPFATSRDSLRLEDHGRRESETLSISTKSLVIARQQRPPISPAARSEAFIVQTRHRMSTDEIADNGAAELTHPSKQNGDDPASQVEHDAIFPTGVAEGWMRSSKLEKFPVKKKHAGVLGLLHFFPVEL